MGSSEKQNKYTLEFAVGAGYVIFFCLALISYIAFIVFISKSSSKSSTPVNSFATNLPPVRPTPHLNSLTQPVVIRLFEDDFTDNHNQWNFIRYSFTEKVEDGKLSFEGLINDNYATTVCVKCPYLKDPFYLQADLTTKAATDQAFGIIFNYDIHSESFYEFEINTEAQKYFLYYHNANNDWSQRIGGVSDQIRSFPTTNTLGLYVTRNTVEFYINGQLVDAYTESGADFPQGNFAFYVDDWKFTLLVDNLKIDKIGQ